MRNLACFQPRRPHLQPLLALILLGGLNLPACLAGTAGSLADAVEHSILRNPDVLAKYHALKAADADQDSSFAGFLPTLDVQAYSGNEQRKDPSLRLPRNYERTGTTVSLRQVLFDGFVTYNDYQRTGYGRLARYYELLATTNSIAYEAVRAFTEVQRSRSLVQLAQQNWATLKTLSSQIAERAQSGVGKQVDLEQANGRLSLAQSTFLNELSGQHDAIQRYEWVVGEPPSVNLEHVPPVSKQLPTDRAFLAEAIRNNPNFLAAVAGIRATQALKAVRAGSFSPTIDFRLTNTQDQNLSGTLGSTEVSTAQFTLSWNLFRGGGDEARLRLAQENVYAAADQRDKSCRDIRQQTAVTWNNVFKLREQLLYLEAHRSATEKAREAYRLQFDIGQRSLLDLLNTENELFESRRAATRARFDLIQAEYQMLMLTQQLLPMMGLAPIAKLPSSGVDTSLPESEGILTCSTALTPYESLNTYGASRSSELLENASSVQVPSRPALSPLAIPPVLQPAGTGTSP